MLSPQDLEAHVVSPAKLDFALRSLRVLKGDLEGKFGVPLRTEVVEKKDVTERGCWGCVGCGGREVVC